VKSATYGSAKSIVMLKIAIDRSTATAGLIRGWSWAKSTQDTPHEKSVSR
jgi:hypothetical protein